MSKEQLDLYIQFKLRSARVSASMISLRCFAHWVTEISRYSHADCLDDAEADLSPRWAHKSECWICSVCHLLKNFRIVLGIK